MRVKIESSGTSSTGAAPTEEPGDPSFLDRAFALFAEHVCESDDEIGLSWNAPVHEGRLTQSSLLGGRIDVDLAQRLKQAFSCDVQVESDVLPWCLESIGLELVRRSPQSC